MILHGLFIQKSIRKREINIFEDGRIYQLEPNNKEYNALKCDDILNKDKHRWFISCVATYIENIKKTSKYYDSYIDWFLENLARKINFYEGCYEFIWDDKHRKIGITFLPGIKYIYFEERYKRIKLSVKNMTEEQFHSPYFVFHLQDVIDKKYKTYIYANDTIMTLDSFIRELPDDKVTYYFGSIIGYYR